MKRSAWIAGGLAVAVLAAGGVVLAGGLQDAPAQDATPAKDPIGDLIRNAPTPMPATTPAPVQIIATPVESAPAADLAPIKPIVVVPSTPIEIAEVEPQEKTVVEAKPEDQVEEPGTPERRQRRPVAVIEAIDKITAESMRFEVEVGGRPVRFNKALIFTARACEVSAPGERIEDSIAYMDIAIQSRAADAGSEPRQIFHGWMFASSPGVNGLQHPVYDAWVVACKA